MLSGALRHVRQIRLTDVARDPSTVPVGAHRRATGHIGNAPRARARSYRSATAAGMPRCTCRLSRHPAPQLETAALTPCSTARPPGRR
ncbi:hypothetical protein CEX93_09100 [Xanthomonas euvesicatoria]|nr:hypothetical protein BJD11_13405 [Xanthomonas euvesicatoria]PWH21994.1 hypothetical protein CDO09_19170 [Xanthomonas perforans]PWH27758.1 hypothetical protein CEX93_09100 [Xanthomonas euvesicatoria]